MLHKGQSLGLVRLNDENTNWPDFELGAICIYSHVPLPSPHCCCPQILPFCSEETLQVLETNLGTMPTVTQMLNSGMTAQGITDRCAGLCCAVRVVLHFGIGRESQRRVPEGHRGPDWARNVGTPSYCPPSWCQHGSWAVSYTFEAVDFALSNMCSADLQDPDRLGLLSRGPIHGAAIRAVRGCGAEGAHDQGRRVAGRSRGEAKATGRGRALRLWG